MSPELGFLLFLTLLWGPTALWLGYRTLRGQQGRFPGPFNPAQLAPDERETLLVSDGFWVCTTCHSLNNPEVSRCYACRMAKDSPGHPAAAPAAAPAAVTVGVPVMAQDSPGRRAAPELPVTVGVPVMAAGLARSSDGTAGTPTAHATSREAPPPPEIPVRAPEPASSAAPPRAPVGAPVCPFLGFKNDPSTRYDFPDPANLCHATSARRGAAAPRRFGAAMGGNGRAESIAVEHQRSRCLTAAHGQCPRYPAAGGAAANR